MGQLSLATGLNTNASSGWFVYKPILLSDPDGHHKSQAAACERTPVESEPEQKKGMEGHCAVLCCTMAGLFGGSACLGGDRTGGPFSSVTALSAPPHDMLHLCNFAQALSRLCDTNADEFQKMLRPDIY